MSATRTCQICSHDYGDKVVPTFLTCCLNHVCFGCAENHRREKIVLLTGNRKMIKCMLCNQEFHSSKETPWKVSKHFIEDSGIEVDLSEVKESEEAMQESYAAPKNKTGATIHNTRRAVQEGSGQIDVPGGIFFRRVPETMENEQGDEEAESESANNSNEVVASAPAAIDGDEQRTGNGKKKRAKRKRLLTPVIDLTGEEDENEGENWFDLLLNLLG